MTPEYVKDPVAHLDYGVDWSRWLDRFDSIATSEWVVEGATTPAVVVTATSIVENNKTLAWIRGGKDGEDYVVRNVITTAQGRKDERSFRILVRLR